MRGTHETIEVLRREIEQLELSSIHIANGSNHLPERSSAYAALSDLWLVCTSAGGVAALAKIACELIRARRTTVEVESNGRSIKLEGSSRTVGQLIEQLTSLSEIEPKG